jgi:acyl-CoA reductase-like NAD-dependent aldehyde dehydrogenase
MTIDGRGSDVRESFDVVNPATGAFLARAPACSPEQLDEAMDAARLALSMWRVDAQLRKAAMFAAAGVLEESVEELAPILTGEQGKPLRDSRAEVMAAAAWMRYFAGLELPHDIVRDDERAHVEIVRRPVGVVAAVTPWNFPVLLAMWKVAPALAAGNTLVIKPSPYTPLSTLWVGQAMTSVLPPGVLNVVTGDDELGRRMIAHPVPRKVSFTGSVASGTEVAVSAAATLKRVTLELGGNDAAIILDDANPRAVARKVFWAAFQNNGQVCSAIKRVYVPETLHDDFVQALTEQADSVRVGDGMDAQSQLGPINNKPQFERVCKLVTDAVSQGATVVAGGSAIPGSGYFYRPTILTNVRHGMRIVDEEQFGPVLPVIPYGHVDEAISMANDSQFGLSGSVWGTDETRAAAVSERLECGTARVNDHSTLEPRQPFGGVKMSGLGVENGLLGLESYTEIQVLFHAKRGE